MLPSGGPSETHSAVPSSVPTMLPSGNPTDTHSSNPSSTPSVKPSISPTDTHSSNPSISPTANPSESPTDTHSAVPSSTPTMMPTDNPTDTHSSEPSSIPSENPSDSPTDTHSAVPSVVPTMLPSGGPSETHSAVPSSVPTMMPSGNPTDTHSSNPSSTPSENPSDSPHTYNPSLKPTTNPSESPTDTHSVVPSSTPTMIPTDHPTDSLSSNPSSTPSVKLSMSPTDNHSSNPSVLPTANSVETFTDSLSSPQSSTSTTNPLENPGAHSSNPSSVPIMKSSESPTDTNLAIPSTTPTLILSQNPTNTHLSVPSSIPAINPSGVPTDTQSSNPNVTYMTNEPISLPTDIPSTLPNVSEMQSENRDQSITGELEDLSKNSFTCDLCPNGILDQPGKSISLVHLENDAVTKTCGALLWDTRAGRNDIDEAACVFLAPFFGAICGCSTFSPFSDKTKAKKKGRGIENKNCKLCSNSRHVFQDPYKPIPIPGSSTTQITCGGLFLGAMSGAVTTSECDVLADVAETCGDCGVEALSFYIEPPPPEQCIDCSEDNESSIYMYKDFGNTGTTFQKAFSAPLHCDDRKLKQKKAHSDKQRKHSKGDDCNTLQYPELEGCVLTPITSFDELLKIQSVIPPGKAAYTAVQKDRLILNTEADKCYNDRDTYEVDVEVGKQRIYTPTSNRNCMVENWMKGLSYGFDDNGDDVSSNSSNLNDATALVEPCESLKSGWTNYKSGTNVPSTLWNNGQPSYCKLGPVQEVGAVWAVEAEGQNYGDLRDVSKNWPLPGAVYKCCKTMYSCFGDSSSTG